MKTNKMIEKLNNSKLPIIKIDESLNRFRDRNMFPEKLERANKLLAKSGLPKELSKIKKK